MTSRSVRIGLAMNTRNEEAKLGAAIESCAGVDEVVVADMASTDATLEVAAAAGARIMHLPNHGYCEPGRQTVIDSVDAEWVLVLDADERLNAGAVSALRRLAAEAGPEISAFLLPRVTMLGEVQVHGTGWSVQIERHPRFFRRDGVHWPTTIHAVPTFPGMVVDLPAGVDVHILHECFEDLTHAWGKFNAYSKVEAQELKAAGSSSVWLSGLLEGIREQIRRYQPDVDGGVSFALSFGMLFYRLGVHLKNMEMQGQLAGAPVPSADAVQGAWQAFVDELRRREIAGRRRQIGALAGSGQLDAAGRLLNQMLATWGQLPELLVEAAALAANAGATIQASALCDQALAADPTHPEARVTRLALDVASGKRAPVVAVAVGSSVAALPGETVVTPLGQAGGDIEAPLDNLPFAPGTLRTVRIAHPLLAQEGPARRRAIVDHLRSLLAPDGRLEVVEVPVDIGVEVPA